MNTKEICQVAIIPGPNGKTVVIHLMSKRGRDSSMWVNTEEGEPIELIVSDELLVGLRNMFDNAIELKQSVNSSGEEPK